jgi:hypothetical protein
MVYFSSGFSSIRSKCIILLRCSAVTKPYLQFAHAAPAWIFQLWTWSFLLVTVLGFFNLLLAMLLDALGSAQVEQHGAPGVVSDMREIVTDLVCAMRGTFFPSARAIYMSDAQFRERLLEKRARRLHEQDLKEVVSDVLRIFFSPPHLTINDSPTPLNE